MLNVKATEVNQTADNASTTSTDSSSIAYSGNDNHSQSTTETKASIDRHALDEASPEAALLQVWAHRKEILYGSTQKDHNAQKRGVKTALYSASQYIKRDAWNWWKVFEAIVGEEMQKNAWRDEIYLAGYADRVFSMNSLVNKVERALDIPFPGGPTQIDRWGGTLLRNNEVNPVRRLFDGFRKEIEQATSVWDSEASKRIYKRWEPTEADHTRWANLSEELLGTTEGQANFKLTSWLIGSAKVALYPGSQFDNGLTLLGVRQGQRKTSFFRDLFMESKNLVGIIDGELDNVELKRFVAGVWLCLLDDIKSHAAGKGNAALKRLYTSTVDNVRRMRENDYTATKRHAAIAATTNNREILSDLTGERRHWVIEIPREFTIPTLEYETIRWVWLMAEWHVKRNTQFWWDADSPQQAADNLYNRRFSSLDEVYEAVSDMFMIANMDAPDGSYWAITPSMLPELAGIPYGARRKSSKSIAAAMESLGWTKKQIKVNKRPKWFWVPENATGKAYFVTNETQLGLGHGQKASLHLTEDA